MVPKAPNRTTAGNPVCLMQIKQLEKLAVSNTNVYAGTRAAAETLVATTAMVATTLRSTNSK